MYSLGAHKNIYAFIVQLKPWLKNKANCYSSKAGRAQTRSVCLRLAK